MSKLALLSVSDKSGIVEFAQKLIDRDYQIISTGGTLKKLSDNGIDATAVEDITKFPEMLDGRVKTLHPFIHAGILAQKDNPEHMKQLKNQGIQPIDLICVNLYPFKSTVEKPDIDESEAIEEIDIGGPSMLRAAAKNYQSVITITDPSDYDGFIDHYDEDQIDNEFRHHLAAKVFRTTAAYDALIAKYLSKEEFPEKLTLTYEKVSDMRYGENNHQKAAYYKDPIPETYSLANANQLHGKQLSYNNMCDVDAALRIIAEYKKPAVVAVKHRSPCGIGVGENLLEAWNLAYESDSMSIFGGIIALNRKVDLETAEKMHSIFLEMVIAPEFTDEAYDVLAKKKNIRLITLPDFGKIDKSHKDEVSLLGGMLIQEPDLKHEEEPQFEIASEAKPTEAQIKALTFGQQAVKNVKSNAVIVTNDHQTLGIGAGQMNRIDSAKIAIQKAMEKDGYENAIMASDAFFPMGDCVDYAAKHDIKAIIEPGGSIRDKESIEKANQYGIALVFTNVRHFKH